MNLDFDFYTLFMAGLQSADAIVATLGIISAAAIAISLVSKIGTWVLPQPSESRVADFLPFDSLLSDGSTLRCSNGTYVRVFKVEGVDLTSAREETIMSMFEARKSWLDNMADLQVTCRVLTIRDRVPMEKNKADFGNKWLKIVDDTWRENLSRVYKNDHYIILSIEDRKDAVKDLFNDATIKLGEKLDFRRYELIDVEPGRGVGTYIHMKGKISTLVILEKEDEELAKGLAMSIAANSPLYIAKEDIPQEVLEKETAIQFEAAKNEEKLKDKPEAALRKIVEGKVNKSLSEQVLLEQKYLLDDSKTVKEVLKEKGNSVLKFVRYQVGEGLEKRSDNFAEEVMKEANK